MKKIKLFDSIFAAVCIVLTVDTIAVAAGVGNSQYFWWLFLLITFFIPYALITAELGSKFPSESGIYGWIRDGLGHKWATRSAWYYWINFPLWMSSLAIIITDVLIYNLNLDINRWLVIIIQLSYIAIVTFFSTKRIGTNKYYVNTGAMIKMTILCSLGLLGVYSAFKFGLSNQYTLQSLLPSFDKSGLAFLCVIVCNFLGFEIIATFSNDMHHPKKEVPKAIIIGGLLITIFYLLPLFSVNLAIPTADLQKTTGLIDTYLVLFNKLQVAPDIINIIIYIVGGVFIYTLIANIISWSFGVSSVVGYAAQDKNLPKFLTKQNKVGIHYYVPIVNAIVAGIIIIIANLMPSNQIDYFWTFFGFNIITFIMTYIPLFPAYLKLRKKPVNKEEVFEINWPTKLITFVTYGAQIILIITIILALFPSYDLNIIKSNLLLIIGVFIAIIVGEIIVHKSKNTRQ